MIGSFKVRPVSQVEIIKCIATPTAALVYFPVQLERDSAINHVNYLVWAHPGVSQQAVTIKVKRDAYDDRAKTVTLQLDANPKLKVGDLLSIQGVGIHLNDGSIADTNPFFVRVNGDGEDPTRRATEAAEDAVAFPLMTEQVSTPPSSSYGPSGGAAGSSAAGGGQLQIGKIAAQAVSDVLGWKVNDSDPKGFAGALTQSFSLQDVEGHVQATWTPRTYAVQTDLAGGITGAQASLYMRAKEALEQALPLLDGLYALNPDSDAEMVTALKDIAKSQFTELVGEMGFAGGPRISRVNQYFHLLLGGPPFPTKNLGVFTVPSDPDEVQGTIGKLRDQLQLQSFSKYVNTVEDEQDVTSLRILSDYITSLAQSWVNNIQFFGLGTKEAFLGTQLVLLSRQLSTIGDTLGEVRFTLDSVFIGPAERQTLQLNLGNDPSMFIEDLLTWVESFARDEGPQLIKDAGKLGVGDGFLPVVENLIRLVREARSPINKGALPEGYKTKRVQNSLTDLERQLEELKRLASEVKLRKPPLPFDEATFMKKIREEIEQEIRNKVRPGSLV